MFKNFLVKKMLKARLGNVPDEQIDQILAVLEENPKFFESIALEIKQKVGGGMGEQAAILAVMETHQKELRELLKK